MMIILICFGVWRAERIINVWDKGSFESNEGAPLLSFLIANDVNGHYIVIINQ